MPTIEGFFWPNKFFRQAFWTKEFDKKVPSCGKRNSVPERLCHGGGVIRRPICSRCGDAPRHQSRSSMAPSRAFLLLGWGSRFAARPCLASGTECSAEGFGVKV